jgi:class 3 adenylate cyclase
MTCPRCQAENPAALKFCGECGARLTKGPDAASAPAPDTYTPNHLAERILTSKAALEGERKQVTVLFADLKGSMELLADRDPAAISRGSRALSGRRSRPSAWSS